MLPTVRSRLFSTTSPVLKRAKELRTVTQTHFFKPLSSPLARVDGQLPAVRLPRIISLKEPVPEPVFPMSDGSGPTPCVTMKNEVMKRRTGLVGTKLGMTTMWDAFGQRRPVTVIEIRENTVLSARFHNARWRLQIAAERHRALSDVPRAMLFVYRRFRLHPRRVVEEFPVDPDACIPTGVELNAAHFVAGQYVDVQGTSRGKGFQGVMKRWGFKGGAATHGNSKNHRTMGSTGQSTTPARVHKGKKMPGHMGVHACKVKNLKVLKVDPHANLVYVAGAVPGPAGSSVNVTDALFKLNQKACFPPESEIPFPTYLGDVSQLPRELLPPAPTQREWELDPLLRQKSEATG